MKKYVILPSCSDLNRGDQALVWETKHIAEEAGYIGEYYMLSEKRTKQCEREGIKAISTVLKHPSRNRNLNNINYGLRLKIIWGIIAIWDLFFSLGLLNKYTRNLFKTFLSNEQKYTLSIIEQADAVMVKGGGFVHAYGGFTSLYSVYFNLYHVILAQSLGKKVYFLPNSFGPFEGICVKWIVKKVLKSCEYVFARESISQKMIKQDLDLDVEVYPDLGFNLKLKDGIEINREKFTEKYNIPKGYKMVAVTMRPYRFPKSLNPQETYRNFQKALAEFLEWLYSQKYFPVVVVHTLAIREHENDERCIMDVTKNISKEKYIIISDEELDCRDLKEIYGHCDYIVGTRFHSVVFSTSQEVPAIAITYGGNKGDGIMKDMNLSEYSIKIEDMDLDTLKQKFNLLLENENDVKKRIKNYLMASEKKYSDLIELMREE